MFTPHSVAAPYLGAELGYEAVGDPDADLRETLRTGGFFGLHLFADTSFAVDLEGAVNLLYDPDADQFGVRGLLYLSVLGWPS